MKKSKKSEKLNGNNKKRLTIFFIFAVLLLIVLLFRIIYWQFIKGDELKKLASNQQTTTKVIEAKRGTIFDRTGQSLAISVEVDTVSVNPSKILYSNKEEVPKEILANKFSELFELNYEEVLAKLSEETSYVTIAKNVQKDKIIKLEDWLKELKITSGINIDSSINRYYPYTTLASNLIGFTGTDTHGRMGLEYTLDNILGGTPGKLVTLTDSINGEIPNQEQTYIEAQDGSDVYLTIDVKVQAISEKYLEQAVKDNNADGGTVIIMNPSSGDVLSMATYPNYDLNTPFTPIDSTLSQSWDSLSDEEKSNILYSLWNNGAVQSTYEPGSTYKLITAATALEEGIITPDNEGDFYCSGSELVGNLNIACWRRGRPHYYQSLRMALANSCNPAFIQLGRKIGASTLYKYYQAFGLFDTTNSLFYGESNSIYHPLNEVSEIDLATMSFGQRFTITPIQLIRAVCAISNEGKLVEPQIVKQTVDTTTNATTQTKTKEIRQVLSKETAETMMGMLEYVVTKGTGGYAKVSGYSVGGKSGTSEPISGSEGEGYVASFIGVSPTTNAQVVVLVAIYHPRGNSYQGGQVAGPVVSQILSEILPYLEIASNDTSNTSAYSSHTTTSLPDVRNMTISKAKETLKGLGFNVNISGNEDSSTVITDQTPKPGANLLKSANVFLYTEANNMKTSVSVPNFKGMTIEQAKNSANSLGLNIAIDGNGIVISQDTAFGKEVEKGTIITLKLQTELSGGY